MTLEAIKAELEKYSPGTWVLPDDLDALAEKKRLGAPKGR